MPTLLVMLRRSPTALGIRVLLLLCVCVAPPLLGGLSSLRLMLRIRGIRRAFAGIAPALIVPQLLLPAPQLALEALPILGRHAAKLFAQLSALCGRQVLETLACLENAPLLALGKRTESLKAHTGHRPGPNPRSRARRVVCRAYIGMKSLEI